MSSALVPNIRLSSKIPCRLLVLFLFIFRLYFTYYCPLILRVPVLLTAWSYLHLLNGLVVFLYFSPLSNIGCFLFVDVVEFLVFPPIFFPGSILFIIFRSHIVFKLYLLFLICLPILWLLNIYLLIAISRIKLGTSLLLNRWYFLLDKRQNCGQCLFFHMVAYLWCFS